MPVSGLGVADGVLPAKISKAGLLGEDEEFKCGGDGCRSGAQGNASLSGMR